MTAYSNDWYKKNKLNKQRVENRYGMAALPPKNSKGDLKKMLEEAAQNTARLPKLNRYEK
jgi:hypothetical protein